MTGSSRSIGAAIARRLAEDGAAVVINYVTTADVAQELADEINAAGRGSAITIHADMSSVAEGSRLVEETVRRLGKLDILVLNAGFAEGQTLVNLTEEMFDKQFLINVKVPLFMTQEAAKYLPSGAYSATFRSGTSLKCYQTTGGRVILLSSAMTLFSGVPPTALVYAATKGAVEQIVRVLAKDLGAKGMTVNAVAPGATDTPLFRKGRTQTDVDALAQLYPLKRIGQTDEIAPIVAFLGREEAGWINGQTIYVNGVSSSHFEVLLS